MHTWYKYILEEVSEAARTDVQESVDSTAEDHAKAMGGYDADECYARKEDFFARYYYDFQWRRLEHYEPFVRKVLPVEARTLSIACGRGAFECLLMEDGYDIVCTDLELPDCVEATRGLFPKLKYEAYDVLAGPADKTYDAVLALGLISLFSVEQFDRFFANMQATIEPGGQLVLDSTGCPDTWLTRFYHNTFLKWDTRLHRFRESRKGRNLRLRTKEHGCFRTDQEIIEAAKAHGFEWRGQDETCVDLSFRRSYYLGKYAGTDTAMGRALTAVGRRMPFMRLFNFVRVA